MKGIALPPVILVIGGVFFFRNWREIVYYLFVYAVKWK